MNKIHNEIVRIWRHNAGLVRLDSDGDKFIITVQLGVDGDMFLSVGYSAPNFALRAEDGDEAIETLSAYAGLYWKWHDLDAALAEADTTLVLSLFEFVRQINIEYNRTWFAETDAAYGGN